MANGIKLPLPETPCSVEDTPDYSGQHWERLGVHYSGLHYQMLSVGILICINSMQTRLLGAHFRQSRGKCWILAFLLVTHTHWVVVKSEAASRRTKWVFSLVHSFKSAAGWLLATPAVKVPFGLKVGSSGSRNIKRRRGGKPGREWHSIVSLSALIELLFLSSPQLRMSFIVFSTQGTTLMKLTEDR